MKMELSKIASRYAGAALDLAVAQGGDAADALAADLEAINSVIRGVPDFSIVLSHPSIGVAEKKRLLLGLFQGRAQELTIRLLSLLADKRRLDLLGSIEQEYLALLRARKNILTAYLTSAQPLSDATVADIKAKLTGKFGKQLELAVEVDQSLIGGLTLRVGDEVIDGSLKGRLAVLERSLLSV